MQSQQATTSPDPGGEAVGSLAKEGVSQRPTDFCCRVKLTLKQTLCTSLLFFIFYFFSYPEVDPDLWGHLFFGGEIVQGAKLLLENLYSYTAPSHSWINHEWLAEVVFYALFRFFGSPGLILFKVALGGGIVWTVDRRIRKKVPSLLIRTLTLVWTMTILSPGFNIRPQLFTYLFFAVFLLLFYRYDEGKKATLYWAPLFMVFWVNLHGGFVAGLGALGLFSLWILWRGVRNRDIRSVITQVLVPVMVSGVALLANPYGSDLLSFLAGDLLVNRPITEWQSISLVNLSFLEFKLAVLLLIVFFLRWRFLQCWDFVLAFAAALLAFRYQRHVPLFAIAAAPLLAKGIQKLSHWIKSGAREWILALGVVTLAVYFFQWIGRIHLEHRFQLVVSPLEYPTQAADFLRQNEIRGNLAVPFDWGEYLIWKLYPKVRVSIDGRYTTAYPTVVIQDHWDWMEGKKGWRRLLENYPAEIAMTHRYHPVTELLFRDPEWVYIYSDPIAFIFVRKTYSQEQLLDRFRRKQLLPPQPPSVYFPG